MLRRLLRAERNNVAKKYYEQHDIPDHEHVVAKSVAIIATPIGVGEIEGEYEMVHVVRKHGKHGER